MGTMRRTSATESQIYLVAQPGDPVVTPDGPGTVVAVEEGPIGGAEHYEILLADNVSGGTYDAREVQPLLTITSRRYSQVPLVCDDCGKPAQSSTAGGPDGHRMLCDECREARGKSPRKTTATLQEAEWKPGERAWFEYHCTESDDSCDAEMWHHSHQQCVIVGRADTEPWVWDSSVAERQDAGEFRYYTVRFDDGFVWDAGEDELSRDKSGWHRPDPPRKTASKTAAGGGKQYEVCPKCGKKGLARVFGYTGPGNPSIKRCRFCGHVESAEHTAVRSLGVDWIMPGKKRPFATSTQATSDMIVMLGEDGHTVQSAYDALLYDPEGKAILAAFIAEGYVNTPLIDLVGGGMAQDLVRKAVLDDDNWAIERYIDVVLEGQVFHIGVRRGSNARDGSLRVRAEGSTAFQGADAVLVWSDLMMATGGRMKTLPEPIIRMISVRPSYRRVGLATEMLKIARQIAPTLQHSTSLTDEGRAWMQSVAMTAHDDDPVEAIAATVAAEAAKLEPKVTRDLQAITTKFGGKLEGLQYRLKSMPSLVRKMNDRATNRHLKGMDLALGIQDAIRYTINFPDDIYAVQVQATIDALTAKGYQPITVENYWLDRDDYQGINTNFRIPGSDLAMELQFHVDRSLRLKDEEVHALYETMRLLPDSAPNKRLLYDAMTKMWDFVKVPAGVERIGVPKKHPAPPNEHAWSKAFDITPSVPDWLRAARLISQQVAAGLRTHAARQYGLPLAEPGTVTTAATDYPSLAEILWERPDLDASEPVGGQILSLGSITRVAITPKELRNGKPIPTSRVPSGQRTKQYKDGNPHPVYQTAQDAIDDPSAPFWWRKIVGPAVERYERATGFSGDVDHMPSIDWCRFRKNSRCMYPKDLDERATAQAGYPVWIPIDRGPCWRVGWKDQEKCSKAEPGPNSGAPVWYPDATTSWDEGGQRMGSLVVSAWRDVQAKAKRIAASGQVHIVAVAGDTITAEVKGDNGVYQTGVTRVPGSKQIALWACGCPWSTYSWGRSGRWKKYEGRMCAHALALVYQAQREEIFGGEITEQTGVPAWYEKATEVIQEQRSMPGVWRLDVAAALESHIAGLTAARRTALARTDVSPGVRATWATALGVAASVARADLESLRLGGDVAPASLAVLGAAGFKPFPVNIEGFLTEVTSIDADERTAEVTGVGTVPLSFLQHPDYHPFDGLLPDSLDVFSSRTAAKTRQCAYVAADGTRCPKDARDGWTTCSSHYSAGKSLKQAKEVLAVDADTAHNGVMVCLVPSDDVRRKISEHAAAHGFNAEPPEQIHITLGYLGKTDAVDEETFLNAVQSFAAQVAPLSGRLGGLGVFDTGEDGFALWVSPDIPDIQAYKVTLDAVLDAAGIPAYSNHGFTPHCTMAYSPEPITEIPPTEGLVGTQLAFNDVCGVYGGVWHRFDLSGTDGAETDVHSEPPLTWEPISKDAGVLYADDVDYGSQEMTYVEPTQARGDHGYYSREQALRDSGMPGGQVFASEDAAQRYVNTVLRAEGITEPVKVTFVSGWGGQSGSQWSLDRSKGRILVGERMHREDYMLHEIAHLIFRHGETGGRGASHGKDFAGVHARLLQKYMGVGLSMFAKTAVTDDAFWEGWEIDGQPYRAGRWLEVRGLHIFDDDAPFPCRRVVGPIGDGFGWEVSVPVTGPGPNAGKLLSGKAKTLEEAKAKALAATKRDEEANARYEERMKGHTAKVPTIEEEVSAYWGKTRYVCSQHVGSGMVMQASPEHPCETCGATSWSTDAEGNPVGWDKTANMAEDIAYDMAAQDVARNWPEEVHMEFFRREGPVSRAEDLRLDKVIPNPDAYYDARNFYENLTDEHQRERQHHHSAVEDDMAWLEANGGLALLHPDPEPALPETDGSGDDEQIITQEMMDASTDLSMKSSLDLPPPESRGWLMQGSTEPSSGAEPSAGDIALAAQAFLAKTALKDFNAAEQAEIIGEGEGVTAGNLDLLQIEGTHYQALEANMDDDESVLW